MHLWLRQAECKPTQRVFFTKGRHGTPAPESNGSPKNSWKEFVETGLSEIFAELNPIEDYTGQKLELRFGTYAFHEPKNSRALQKKTTPLSMLRFMQLSS
jgi:DNA-directed RNA polymerase beta subunit